MGNSISGNNTPCKDGSCLNKKGNYRAKWLKEEWKGTPRDGYRYSVGYAPTGRATCRHCKAKIAKGTLHIRRSTPNPFDAEGGYSDYTQSFHAPSCAFEAFARSKCQSKVPTDPAGLSHFDELEPADKKAVRSALEAFSRERRKQCPPPPKTAEDPRRAEPAARRPSRARL